ncbi:MAG TPA: type II toxin-antitoxin system RelE/ParE family toxin [Bacteroidia bacterium]|jgi:plasmid stabilization system protein ParE|nr:type II toxin-antitoxin system RelE/ParE family toxin [Bacteroidia bacterium]
MAKEIVWSQQAINSRKNILNYWVLKNQSAAYSIKLDELFREAVTLISKYPIIGKPTDIKDTRAKKLRDYIIFYGEVDNKIHIFYIWDNSKKATVVSRLRGRR